MDICTTTITGNLHRLINSRYPPVGLFDNYVDTQEELQEAFLIENMTNPRVNHALGAFGMIPEDEVIIGLPTASVAMAAFIHVGDEGSRFNDYRLGAWYAATDIETAIAETVYHNSRRLKASEGGFPNVIQLREYVTTTPSSLIDLRGLQSSQSELYYESDYTNSQKFGNAHRWPFADPAYDGIAYDSVRHKGGQNVCLFRPKAIDLPITQGHHYQYRWDWHGKVSVTRL